MYVALRKARVIKAERMAAVMMGMLLLFVGLFSAFHIGADTGHDCEGRDCLICDCLSQYKNNLRQAGEGLAVQTAIAALFAFFLLPRLFNFVDFSRFTPVAKKVRLNH